MSNEINLEQHESTNLASNNATSSAFQHEYTADMSSAAGKAQEAIPSVMLLNDLELQNKSFCPPGDNWDCGGGGHGGGGRGGGGRGGGGHGGEGHGDGGHGGG